MFREMRRKKQLLPEGACVAILQKGTSGVLAVLGDDAYPYAVPLSYVYHAASCIFTAPRQATSWTPFKAIPKRLFA